jgi:hypothetical protein
MVNGLDSGTEFFEPVGETCFACGSDSETRLRFYLLADAILIGFIFMSRVLDCGRAPLNFSLRNPPLT